MEMTEAQVSEQCANCEGSRMERIATAEAPFHFIDSGLPNVYLVGIRYFACGCGSVSSEIPAGKRLMQAIARDLVETPESLTGGEIRFLRKRLGKKAAEFAKELGIEPEHLSRLENGKRPVPESLDKLIRLLYAVSANDAELLDRLRKTTGLWLADWRRRQAGARIVKGFDDGEWMDAMVAQSVSPSATSRPAGSCAKSSARHELRAFAESRAPLRQRVPEPSQKAVRAEPAHRLDALSAKPLQK